MLRRPLLLVALLMLGSILPGFSNSFSNDTGPVISGKIKSLDGAPIPYANVLVLGTVKGAYTNLDGTFKIFDLPEGQYTIKISAVGFKSFTKEVLVKGGELEELDLTFSETGVEMPQITVISGRDRIFSKVPGSVSYIDKTELNNLKPISGNEALRRSPGVHVVDEEGVGMRVNIGIRGLDPDRSRSVLVLEDGIPVALAPYGEPEMYYSPAIDRMSGIEVLKGSGQILFGPQTIGGVVNYITANPPEEQEGSVRLQGGKGGFFSGLVNYGNTVGNTGIQVNLLKKRADNVGPTKFDITDFNTKLLFNLNEKSSLGVKLGVYDEASNSTYVGLTQTMYSAGGQDYARIAPDDRLDVRRYALSFSHQYKLSGNVKLRTIAYGYTTTRNWNRQDFQEGGGEGYTPPSNWTGVIWGDPTVSGGALYMRNGTGNRNRQFEVAGIEPRLEINHRMFGKENELITGTRYLYERAFEQRVNGTKAGVKSGNLVEDEIRAGYALSAYAQNKISISDRVDFHAGLRYEQFDYERDINRRSFGSLGVRDTVLVAGSQVHEIIPGAGFNYRPANHVNIFGGVHKGFAPPRTKDAITSLGQPLDLEAEKSTNYELGLRSDLGNWLFVELTGFWMDFSNQVIPVSESSGGTGTGLVNGGKTLQKGLEAAAVFDLSKLLGLSKTQLSYDINATYVNATFSEDRFISDTNVKGNRTPYAPEWFVNSALTLSTHSGFGARLIANYVSSQFTDELNTVEAAANGRTGEISGYFVMDAVLSYDLAKWNTSFNLSAKNITDERYISSRRPQGIRVGLPRFITAGVELRF